MNETVGPNWIRSVGMSWGEGRDRILNEALWRLTTRLSSIGRPLGVLIGVIAELLSRGRRVAIRDLIK